MRRSAMIGALALASALAAGAAFAQAAPKIGVFDAGRLTEETEEGKKVQATLGSLRDKKQAELSAKEKEVNDLQDQLNKQGLSLSGDKRSQMEKDIQKKALDLNQMRQSAQSEMQLEVQEAQSKFQQQLLSVIEAFGKDEGFSLILERSLVAYATPAIDVTTALVDRFNKMIPSAAAAAERPSPKPAAPKPAASPTPQAKK